jgi:helicase MOV-10
MLAPTAPYKPPPKRVKEPETEVVDGVKPPQLAQIAWDKNRMLLTYEVPTWLETLVQGGTMASKLAEIRSTALPRTLNPASYGRHWQTILWLEEMQAEWVCL